MTDPIRLEPAAMPPMRQISRNDTLPITSPSSKYTLIVLASVLGFIGLVVMYWKVAGF